MSIKLSVIGILDKLKTCTNILMEKVIGIIKVKYVVSKAILYQ